MTASEFEQQWQPSERDNRLHDLATRYHTETEAYDWTVCTGPIRDGAIVPGGAHEFVLVNRNAQAVERRLQEEAAQHGISPKELHQAISRWDDRGQSSGIAPIDAVTRRLLNIGTIELSKYKSGQPAIVATFPDGRLAWYPYTLSAERANAVVYARAGLSREGVTDVRWLQPARKHG